MKILSQITVLLFLVCLNTRGQEKKEDMNLKSITPNLVVNDVNKTVDYYKITLGFETVVTVPDSGKLDFALMQLDNVTIMFQSLKGFVEALPEYRDHKVGGTLFLYIDVNDLDAIYNKAVSAGAEIVMDINTTFYGAREFTIRDCDGYMLIFAEEQEPEKN